METTQNFVLHVEIIHIVNRIDKLINNLNNNANEIKKLLENINQLMNMGVDTSEPYKNLKMQLSEVNNAIFSVNMFNNTFLFEIYSKLYLILLGFAEKYIKILKDLNKHEGVYLVDLFGGYTNENNAPINGGHYKRFVNITNVKYTYENCVEICNLIENIYIKMYEKIEYANNIIDKTNISINRGYNLFGLSDSLLIVKGNIFESIEKTEKKFACELSKIIENAFINIDKYEEITNNFTDQPEFIF